MAEVGLMLVMEETKEECSGTVASDPFHPLLHLASQEQSRPQVAFLRLPYLLLSGYVWPMGGTSGKLEGKKQAEARVCLSLSV